MSVKNGLGTPALSKQRYLLFQRRCTKPHPRSAAQLSSQRAQSVIEGKGLRNVVIGAGHADSGIEEDILILHVSRDAWAHQPIK